MRKVICDRCHRQIDEHGYSWAYYNCLMGIGWDLPKMIPNFELCPHCHEAVMLYIEGPRGIPCERKSSYKDKNNL